MLELLRCQQNRDRKKIRHRHGYQCGGSAKQGDIPFVPEQHNGDYGKGDQPKQRPFKVRIGHELRREDIGQKTDQKSEQRDRPGKPALEDPTVCSGHNEVKDGISGQNERGKACHKAFLLNRCASYAENRANCVKTVAAMGDLRYKYTDL